MKDDTFQQAAHAGGEGIGLLMIGKTAISLLVVIAIILGCAWLLKRLGPNRRAGTQHLRVVASTPVGQRERVVIVEVADRWLVLGVGGGQVTRLDSMDPPTPPAVDPAASPLVGSFASRFGQALKHNARDSLKRRSSRDGGGVDS
ncbi:flagellar biosynthetic protein FliO [Salinicola sp. MH3R3-1]|uniref:flagellar biosynthetic protein FliO n=1 Tax=Salinicola TaxID=404432 RepID=UPI00094F27E7|nr:flagellar biosynthetic protein FliO [Salinicola sp. MH3R3-1]OLO07926.1 flagellar biosynthetic protein FliO [Salinicola sp. MH3R3-1]